MTRLFSSLILALVTMMAVQIGLADVAITARPLPHRPASEAEAATDWFRVWNQASVVIIGELTKFDNRGAARSLPPIYMNDLEFKIERVLRGQIKEKSIGVHHAHRSMENFPYRIGAKYILSISTTGDRKSVGVIRLAEEDAIAEAELAAALPVGWERRGDEIHSPWAVRGKDFWRAEPAQRPAEDVRRCAITGRPALIAGDELKLTIKPVEPKESIQWTNPDGDGEFDIILSNPTDKPITVPAVLTREGVPIWGHSLVILAGGDPYTMPDAEPLRGKVESLKLEPGQSITTRFNVLKLDGPAWPRGGYRIDLSFAIGELSAEHSFYYMSRHHDPLRRKAQGLPEE
ncbi:MAG: hypothetical protein JJU36_01190 [Phycisphaeraceae bacterium]|nr:hypothetical protein [Phycisphaeraceae bacterium]